MENIKIKTGIVQPEEPPLNVKTFVLCFMAIIWRRVWITSTIYCNHNNIKLDRSVVLKSLKFNIFSEAGIGHTLLPYIKEALTVGFLMPQTFEKNIYATRAVNLYKEACETVKLNDKKAETKFIHDYMMTIFSHDKKIKNTEETNKESQDTLNISDNNNDNEDLNKTNPKWLGDICTCKFCTLVDSWDVNVDLIFSDDPYKNILMTGLMNM